MNMEPDKMQERPNLLKAALAAGRPHIGVWCSLASALTTEVVAGSGAGWLLIDGEHSPNDLRTIMAQLQVLGGFPCEGANAFGRVAGYHARARDQQLLAVQIESETGVASAAEIAAVDGVDVLFVGPGDLSTNMSAMGNPGAGHVQEAISSVRKAAAKAGKASGILAPLKADSDRYLADGFTMVAVGSDLALLARGSDALIASFNS